MAVDVDNTQLFAGFTSDGTDITIPIANLTGLSIGDAATSGGDYRELLRAILEVAQAHLDGLAAADVPAGITMLTRESSPSLAVVERKIQTAYQMDLGTPDIIAAS